MREDWIECTLEDISYKITDGSHNPPKKESNGYLMLSAKNIANNKIDFSEGRFISKENFEIENKRTQIEPNDILLTIVATIGRSAVVKEYKNQFVLQRSVAVIGTFLNSFYLNFQLQNPFVQSFFMNNAKGTAQKGIYLKTLSTTPLQICSIPEQRAIVKKIETLFSSLDASIADLKKSQEQLKFYRQAVLKKAFEGELTKKWRESNNIENQITFKQIKEFSKVKGGKRLPKGHNYVESSKYPYLRVTDFDRMSIKQNNLKYISKDTQQKIERYVISKSDVYISIAGSIGLAGCIPSSLNGANLTENAAKITELNEVDNWYLAYYLNSPNAKSVIKLSTIGNTQPKLALFRIEQISVPIPSSIKEQEQIVKEIESRLSICDIIEKQIKNSLNQAEALRQSILKKAFEGSLLTEEELRACKTEPDYEPASVLLERIKAEKQAHKSVKKINKKKVS